MSDGLNRVQALGNLGGDPQLSYTQGGKAKMSFSIAATTSFYSTVAKERKEQTEWINCVMWGPRAETLNKYLHKGMRVMIEGSLHTHSWDDKNGAKHYRTEVNVEELWMLDSKRDGGSGQPPKREDPASATLPLMDDDIPF